MILLLNLYEGPMLFSSTHHPSSKQHRTPYCANPQFSWCYLEKTWMHQILLKTFAVLAHCFSPKASDTSQTSTGWGIYYFAPAIFVHSHLSKHCCYQTQPSSCIHIYRNIADTIAAAITIAATITIAAAIYHCCCYHFYCHCPLQTLQHLQPPPLTLLLSSTTIAATIADNHCQVS